MANTQDLIQSLDNLDKKFAQKETAKLRLYAYGCGWPLRIAGRLKIVPVSEGHFAIDYPKDIETQVLDLELGVGDIPPNPVMRTYMNRFTQQSVDYDDDLADQLSNWSIF